MKRFEEGGSLSSERFREQTLESGQISCHGLNSGELSLQGENKSPPLPLQNYSETPLRATTREESTTFFDQPVILSERSKGWNSITWRSEGLADHRSLAL